MLKKKIAFFNSDEVMGEQAFQNIKDQINGQQETRTRLADELDKLKQQRIELNEQPMRKKLHYKFVTKIF